MKRKMNGKLAMIVTAAMLCITGCGMESPIEDDSAVASESLPGMVEVEEKSEEESSVQEQWHQTLEEAEREAAASQKKSKKPVKRLEAAVWHLWQPIREPQNLHGKKCTSWRHILALKGL